MNLIQKFKEFAPTTWSVKNRTGIYLLIIILSVAGIVQFLTLPKEQFPDIVIPTIYVSTVYVGNSPKDIENLVTRPIEKQIKSITGAKIKKLTSTSQQDYAAIVVEFDPNVRVDIGLQKVKDAVDKAKQDLPTDLTSQPLVMEVSMSEVPVVYLNLSGPYDLRHLKKIADDMKDALEELKEINRVDIVGAPEREFQINIDNYRMQAADVTFDDIANAVQSENMDVSGGLLRTGKMKRSVQMKGQFKTAADIEQVIIRNHFGEPIYLKDIATIIDTTKDVESFSRLDGMNVVTLNIIKRSGENLIETIDNIKKRTAEMQLQLLPKDLKITITGDTSIATSSSFKDLVNSIVIGFILVLVILMFFMGVTNAFFVALSVPLSMFVAFVCLPFADMIIGTHVTLNFMVLFALLFGLGIIVDDAIVVIENTHRIYTQGLGKVTTKIAARMAAGEVFVPVLAGTLTTLAPFIPLMFWPGIIGKFMIYLPLMLIFTLSASLIVAFIMNPVFAVDFMNHEDDTHNNKIQNVFKKSTFWIFLFVGILFDLLGVTFLGNILILGAILLLTYQLFTKRMIHYFQNHALPWIMNHYESLLHWALKGWRPVQILLVTIAFSIVTVIIFVMSVNSGRVPITFFPDGDPNQLYVYLKMPVGTDILYTDSITKVLEKRVSHVLRMDSGRTNPVVESVISNVAIGASENQVGNTGSQPNLGRIQISFVEYEKRNGVATRPILETLRNEVKGIPGAEVSIAKEQNGPPTDPPINVEISSDDFDDLIKTAVGLKNYLEDARVQGVEKLKMDVDLTNPEVTIKVNRQRALSEGVSSAQIGTQIRTALFGREVSKIKIGKEEYKVQLRNKETQRSNLTDLVNMKIFFRDMASGGMKCVPIISLIDIDPTNTLGSVKRKNQKRIITLTSNVLQGYTPTAVNIVLAKYIKKFSAKIPQGVSIAQTGEGEQQAETGSFLVKALAIALMLIILILVLQFNSVSKPIIIFTEVVFSAIGVFLGFTLTGMTFSVVMTGMGIVGLAGIVVKNGILVIEFADELRTRGYKTKNAVIEAGKTRIIPVLLTAAATITGFIPIALGFNINFITLFSELNPHIFFGGDSVTFWKPLSWTIIFGLAFAFFMTLFVVPSMYLIAERLKRPMRKMFGGTWISFLGIPPFTIVFILLIPFTLIRQSLRVAKRRVNLRAIKTVNEKFIGSWF